MKADETVISTHMRCLASSLALSILIGCDPQEPDDFPVPATRPVDTDVPTMSGFDLRVVGYNVESGDAEAETIAANVSEVLGEHIWGFSETLDQSWLDAFAVAADDGGQDFQTLLGTTGSDDRLGVVYDASALDYVSHEELDAINVGGSARAPLVVRFRVRDNGVEFKFMVNHLWRTDGDNRHEQAERLNDWIAAEVLPVIALGDYNFDWDVEDGENDHDLGYDLMTANNRWSWVRPDELIATQCSFSYDGVLDFVFVGNDAKDWPASSEILFPENIHCQDSASKPDHRPVDARIRILNP